MVTRYTNLSFLLLLLLCFAGFNTSAQEFKVANTERISPEGTIRWGYAKFSPDGKQIAMSHEDYAGLYVLTLGSNTMLCVSSDLGAGYRYSWSSDSKQVLYRATRLQQNKKVQQLKSSNTYSGVATVLSAEGRRLSTPVWVETTSGLRAAWQQAKELKQSATQISISSERKSKPAGLRSAYYYDGAIVVMDNATKLLEIRGEMLMNPEVSPNGKYLVYSEKENLKVRNLETGELRDLGQGYRASWSANSQWLVFHDARDNGVEITWSELFVIRPDGTGRQQITNTPNLLESTASWAPDGRSILCNEERSGAVYQLWFQ